MFPVEIEAKNDGEDSSICREAPCSLVKVDVSEVNVASIFRTKD
jgi:hypothetical protein